MSGALSKRIAKSPYEAHVASMAEEILRKTQLANPEEGLALAPSGWHPVRASFEVDKVKSHDVVDIILVASSPVPVSYFATYRGLLSGGEANVLTTKYFFRLSAYLGSRYCLVYALVAIGWVIFMVLICFLCMYFRSVLRYDRIV